MNMLKTGDYAYGAFTTTMTGGFGSDFLSAQITVTKHLVEGPITDIKRENGETLYEIDGKFLKEKNLRTKEELVDYLLDGLG